MAQDGKEAVAEGPPDILWCWGSPLDQDGAGQIEQPRGAQLWSQSQRRSLLCPCSWSL